jgi:hypothetical protein
LVTLVLVWTKDLHNLIWQQVYLVSIGPLVALGFVREPWFWLLIGYSYLLVLWGSVQLVGMIFEANLILERYREEQRWFFLYYRSNPLTNQSSFGVELYARREDGSEFPMGVDLSRLEDAQASPVLVGLDSTQKAVIVKVKNDGVGFGPQAEKVEITEPH